MGNPNPSPYTIMNWAFESQPGTELWVIVGIPILVGAYFYFKKYGWPTL